jgi:hypothetical protein
MAVLPKLRSRPNTYLDQPIGIIGTDRCKISEHSDTAVVFLA